MIKKIPFIEAISIVLKTVWYIQWIFLSVLIIISVLIATNSSIIDINKIDDFHIQFARVDIQNTNPNTDIQQNNAFLTNGEGRLHINDNNSYIFLRLLSVFIDTLLYILIIFLLRKIFFSIKAGVFFSKKNGIYIKRIAFGIVAIVLIPAIMNYFINLHISKTIFVEGILFKARFGFDFRTLFLALLIFVIAKAFIRGAELKEDHDLTI